MDEAHLSGFRRRSEAELARTAPPAGFPALPDIPLGRYTDAAFYELERTRLFGRSWLYAAHDSELPTKGSYVRRELPGADLVVVRGDDGQVRAFRNACRHRGAPVTRDDAGTTRAFVCQYHSWTYDLEGRLRRVPDERDFIGLCTADRSLPSVRCEAWGGWHFVNLDAGARPLLDALDPLPRLLADVAASPLRLIDARSVELACNWKILAEAFLEVYHARTVHSTTVAPTLDTRGTVVSLFANGHQSMLSPVRSGSRTDGREALATIARVPAVLAADVQAAHGIFPNIVAPLDARGFPFLVFWPTAIDRTRLDTVWFAADWGDGPLPGRERWDARLARFDAVMEEDYRNLVPIQRSMDTAAHGGQVISYAERRIWHVHAWIDRVIGAELVPSELRVPDLLADWVEDQLGGVSPPSTAMT